MICPPSPSGEKSTQKRSSATGIYRLKLALRHLRPAFAKRLYYTIKPGSRQSGIYFRFEDANTGKVSIVLRVIEAVTDKKFIRHFPAAIINFHCDLAAHRLGEQRAKFEACRLARFEQCKQVAHRDAGIDNVLTDNYMAVLNIRIEIFADFYRPAGLCAIPIT